jgi:uncharacterized protein YlxP (DUF503 family)
MTVGIARITLFLPTSHSLKDKRAVLRRLKALVRNKFNAAIAEVGEHELWQRVAVGVAVVGSDRPFTEAALDELLRFVEGHADVTHVEREFQSYNQTFGVGAGVEHWNP